MADQLGNLWVGSWNGFFRTDIANPGKFARYLYDPKRENSDPGSFVNAIEEDLAGFIWIATGDGLVRLDPESGRMIRYRHDPHRITSYNVCYTKLLRTVSPIKRAARNRVASPGEFESDLTVRPAAMQ